MKLKYLLLLMIAFLAGFTSNAQVIKTDSARVAKTLHELLRICRTVNFADPNVTKLGTFYKAAPYIVYRGEDKSRAWKVMSDYTNAYEKKGVDDVCERINRTANLDSSGYKIIHYRTEKESEGTWHVLMVSYKKKGIEKSAAFAFLKIGNKFGLGDID
ncbi:MAG: hypothetical protein IPP81_14930 [Chitinophagaceae bacterium]|nr:hypothetical protein [Chitinophagaceae bacterium]